MNGLEKINGDEDQREAYQDALESMPPLKSAAHRTAEVLGCAGVLLGLGGGIAAAIAAWKFLGWTGDFQIGLAIAVGSGLPFLATLFLEVNRRRALKAAEKPRLTVGTHAAFNALRGDSESATDK